MTLAHLVLEIRHRANAAGRSLPRAVALEQAARAVLEPCDAEAPKLAHRILAALLGMESGEGFDVAVLDSITPDAILLLDIILVQIVETARHEIKPVH